MGKQISQKPEKAEVNRNGGLGDIKRGRSLFTCFNCAMMLYTAALAIIVAAVIVKASDLQILNEEKDFTISELRSEVESVKKQLHRSVAESEAQQQNSEKKINELSSQVKEAVETLNKHTREFKAKEKVYESEIRLKNAEIKANNAEVTRCSSNLEKSNSLNGKVSDEVDELKLQKKNLQETIFLQETQKNDLENKLSNAVNDLNENIYTCKEMKTDLEDELKIKYFEIEKYKNEVSSSKEQLETQVSLIETIRTEMSEIEGEKAELEGLLTGAEAEKELVVKENSEIAAQLEMRINEIESITTTVKSLESDILTKGKRISDLMTEREEREKKYKMEKIELMEKVMIENQNKFESEKIKLQQEHSQEVTILKRNQEKLNEQNNNLLRASESNLREKDEVINSLKEQNLQISEELSHYSDEIKSQARILFFFHYAVEGCSKILSK